MQHTKASTAHSLFTCKQGYLTIERHFLSVHDQYERIWI
jgi:hypothetical protein